MSYGFDDGSGECGCRIGPCKNRKNIRTKGTASEFSRAGRPVPVARLSCGRLFRRRVSFPRSAVRTFASPAAGTFRIRPKPTSRFYMPGERMPSAAKMTGPVAAFESGNGSRSVCRQGHSDARCCPPGHRKPLSGNAFERRNGTNSTISPAVESPKPFPRPARFADGSPREGIRVPSKGGSQNAPKKTGTTFSPRTSVRAGRTLAVPGMSLDISV